MRRFFQPAGPDPDGMLVLDESESRHAAQVIRLRAGEGATVLDGRGGEWACTAVEVNRREVRLRVDKTVRHEPPAVRLRLVQAITKGKSFELVLQKAVELGVTEIQPLISERVVARPDPGEFEGKVERWRQMAVEAIKQCGSPWLPVVHPPGSLPECLRGGDRQLVAALHPHARHPSEVLRRNAAAEGSGPEEVSVWIGPEGDFTTAELEQLVNAGVQPITLGPTILRSETAALCALSIVRHELTRPE